MRKIKMILTILTTALFLCVISFCVGCGCSDKEGSLSASQENPQEGSSVHIHAFEEWKVDKDFHWQECVCGEN